MKKYEPTEEQKHQVMMLKATGTTNELIANIIGISIPTLRKAFRSELETGLAETNAKVAESLFNQALAGNVTAQIFWLKTRAGWRETDRLELTGADGGPIQGGVVLIPQKFQTMEEWVQYAKEYQAGQTETLTEGGIIDEH